MVIMLFYGVAAEVVGGMAAITGSFLAGLMFARCDDKERLQAGVSALAYGLFVPIFFVSIGLEVNARDLGGEALLLSAVIIVVAIASKLFGSGLGARWAGFTWRESWQMGAGMVSRGEVGLIVANVGIGAGLVGGEEFSAIVAMVLATTIVTPPMLRALFAEPKNKLEEPAAEGKEA
jgi:Kef-type K+ transport system membrane component KefB